MTDRHLRLAYRDIPPVPCRTGCTDCCGPAPFSSAELARVEDLIPADAMLQKHRSGTVVVKVTRPMKCAFASDEGCTIYAMRPLVCRLFGAVKGEPRLTCSFGCIAAKPLTKHDAAKRMVAVFKPDAEAEAREAARV
jgi:Fe-S-cluster containining protein